MSSESNRTEFKLKNSPGDCVQSVKFSPVTSQFLLVASWDKTVRLYDVAGNNMRLQYQHKAAVLDCCFQDAVHVYSGGIDCFLKSFDLNSNTENILGSHDAPIRCVEYNPEVNVLVTGSWDSSIKVWDPRQTRETSQHNMNYKVYTMDMIENRIVVGTSKKQILVWDLRNMGQHLIKRDSSLKYQTRCIRCFPAAKDEPHGYVVSSIEGRVAVEYLDPNAEVQKKKYAFKCHRQKEGELEKVYPVNAISFHSGYRTFATGGSDGYVNIWDGFNKKRLCQFHKYATSISSLAFSSDGQSLAIACSHMFENELPSVPENSIFIRKVTDQETKPK